MFISILATIAYYLLLLYFFVMWARFILDLARTFLRDWRPSGFGLLLAEGVYGITDPPMRLVRRIMPPIRLGAAALDFGWSIVMLAVVVLIYITAVLRSVA